MSPVDAYNHIFRIIEEVNALLACYYIEERMQTDFSHDECVHFSPTKGNVIFCCGSMGWGFRTIHFAELFAKKYGASVHGLLPGFWGDYYYDPKNKTIKENASLKNKKPIFVQFILENIWAVYDAFLGLKPSEDLQTKIIDTIDPKLKTRVQKFPNNKDKYIYLMRSWLPLFQSMMTMVVEKLPSPSNLSLKRIVQLLSSSILHYKNLPPPSQALKKHFQACSSDESSPVIVYISKMIYYDQKEIWRANMHNKKKVHSNKNFIAFSRIFSGKITCGQKLYVLTPKFIPGQVDNKQFYSEIIVEDLYIFMGRDLYPVECVPAGNIFGIGGLDDIIYKSGTVSSTLNCPSFAAMNFEVFPLFSVSVEPEKLGDFDKLVSSLDILRLSDPILQITQSDSGEYIISVIGEVHLSKCIIDLRELMDNMTIHISEPIIAFRETIRSFVPTQNTPKYPNFINILINPIDSKIDIKEKDFIITTNDERIELTLSIENMDKFFVSFLENNQPDLKIIKKDDKKPEIVEFYKFFNTFTNNHPNCFEGKKYTVVGVSSGLGTCLLVKSHNSSNGTIENDTEKRSVGHLDRAIYSGFDMSCQSGPLMSYPLHGICFIVKKIVIDGEDVTFSEYYCDLSTSGQITSLTRQLCLSSLVLSNRLRIAVPFYKCIVRCHVKELSAIYNVLGRRYSKIVSENQIEGTTVFLINTLIAAPESLGLSEDIKSKTAGLAQIELFFHRWKTILADPFDTNSENADVDSLLPPKVVQDYILKVRKRKGLKIDEKVVEVSEKQRTNKRNK